MKDVNVAICRGLRCSDCGAWDLGSFKQRLAPEIAAHVQIEHVRCMGFCVNPDYGKPPFAKVQDRLISSATVDDLLREVIKAAKEE